MSVSGSIQQIKESMRNAWMEGDFGVVAKTISGGAEAFVERLAIPSGTRVSFALVKLRIAGVVLCSERPRYFIAAA